MLAAVAKKALNLFRGQISPEPKVLKFSDGHLELVRAGMKRITIRKYRPEAHRFAEGEIFIGEFPGERTLRLCAIANTQVLLAGEISNEAAREDGFRDAAHMIDVMRGYYPDFGSETLTGIIRFTTI